MKACNVLLGALIGEAIAVVNKWNPEGFDWASQKTRNNVAWQNIESPPRMKQLSIQNGNQTDAENATAETDVVVHSRVAMNTALGVALRDINWSGAARSATGTAGTAVGCGFAIRDKVQDSSEVADSDVASCVLSVAAGIWGWQRELISLQFSG